MMSVEHISLGRLFQEPLFNDIDVLAGRNPGTVSNTENMRIDRYRRLTEGDVENNIGRLATNAG